VPAAEPEPFFKDRDDLKRVRLPDPLGDNPMRVQVRDRDPVSTIIVFNMADTTVERTYPLRALGVPAPALIFDWTAQRARDAPVHSLILTLAPHEGTLLFVGTSPIRPMPC
jgi:hypothetical protein